MGAMREGAFYNHTSDLVVERTEADAVGGFRLSLSGGFVLAAFPATCEGMQWLLSNPKDGSLSLMDGRLSE